MKRIACLIISLCMLFCASCSIRGKEPDRTNTAVDLLADFSKNTPENLEYSQGFYDAYYNMAAALLSISDDDGGLVSPLSVMIALSMAANGASSDTQSEMVAAMTDEDIGTLNRGLAKLVGELVNAEDAKLSVANSVWYRDAEQFKVKDSFLQVLADYYTAQVYKEPFDTSTLSNINGWVNEHTDGMIDKIIDIISPDDMLILLNALAFDAKWADEYSAPRDGDFTCIGGRIKQVKMLQSTEKIYFEGAGATGFKKYYKNKNYSFAVMLPETADIKSYIAELTGEKIQEFLASATEEYKVYTKMPEFEAEYSYSLKDKLREMGMGKAFSDEADFSNMSDSGLYIGEVIHKTYIKVDKKGTKAAAVTGIATKTAAMVDESDRKYVYADRPYIYMIIDEVSGLPVFIGNVMNV